MKPRRALRLLVLVTALTAAGVAVAQVSTNYNLNWHVLSGGGGSRASASYRVDDTLGQWPEKASASASYRVDPGFWYGLGGASAPLPPTPTPTPTLPPGSGDAFEVDDTCGLAHTISTDGSTQTHTFHDAGDEDWVKFQALANKSYIIQVDNAGVHADAVVLLYDQCAQPPLSQGYNAFGSIVQMQWSSTAAATYYLRLMQNDPAVYGTDTNYDLSVVADYTPPAAPRSVRSAAADQRIIVQWRRGTEPDLARYRVRWGPSEGTYSSYDEVDGADNTYYEITGLTNGVPVHIVVHAIDSSGNVSPASVDVANIPSETSDPTIPAVVLTRPTTQTTYATSMSSVSVGGTCSDSGGNLSRLRVRNTTTGAVITNTALAGSTYTCTVESLPLQVGDNVVQATVYDAVGNSGSDSVTITRLPGTNGAVVIVGGHNDSATLQTNINNTTNRAYRVFLDAGFAKDKIRYLSPSYQDADGDAVNDVYTITTVSDVQLALTWAQTATLGGPFFLYMMDHGMIEKFCADGCPAGSQVTPDALDAWLTGIETACPTCPINVILEACHSGSFIDRVDDITKSISKNGRVVIASTGRTNNAYASASGALFSDAFFSSVSEGNNLLVAFNAAKAAVAAGSTMQTPWLDDNGDALYTPSDGVPSSARYVATNFGTALPTIISSGLSRTGSSGTITATVIPGDSAVKVVWAAVYAPSYQEPTYTSLDLGVPLIKLDPDAVVDGLYLATYNGFTEEGQYRVVIYAADSAGNQAMPRLAERPTMKVYLPVVMRGN